MTNEEARIIVEQLDNYLSHTCQDYGERDHEAMMTAIKALEQESQTFEWCTDCREYDQEKHCCHRWSKVIRDTVEEMKQPCEDDKGKLSWLGKNCKDCGNEKCKKLGTLPKGYDCALWQEKESEE